ncbi:hypothetical protein QNK12_25970 [Neobacillus cucumis]|nr:hypothetical protein QNK12_25970 [Neobacillus cucumis]
MEKLNKIHWCEYLKKYKYSQKRGNQVVNENWNEFNKIQQKHRGSYLGSEKRQQPGMNDPEYNSAEDTDKSVGATGRDI